MPGLMILSATLPLDRLGLLGHEDDAHAAFADLLQQLVRADDACRAVRAMGCSKVAAASVSGESKKLPAFCTPAGAPRLSA